MNRKVGKRKEIKPGEKRNISFPLDIDTEFLRFLNNQSNFSGALISLAIQGFKNKKLENLEKRIESLEFTINKKSLEAEHKESNKYFSFDLNDPKMLDPDEEDDHF
jgi:hypothetical protein